MSVSAGSPINMWLLCIVFTFCALAHAAQQQPLRGAGDVSPKRVAVIGRHSVHEIK